MIDFAAREDHFVDHVAPIWKALPSKKRGVFYVPNEKVQAHARSLGIVSEVSPVPRSSKLCLVAAWGDLSRLGPQTEAVYMEHGCGITYGDQSPSYAGGTGRENVALFLCPNENVATLNERSWPGVPAPVIGCPKLDEMKVRGLQGRVVAVSFHWACMVTPESAWAFPFYRNYLRKLAERAECEMIGHAHPRAYVQLAPMYRRMGIEPVKHFRDVMDRADMYVIDNSSTLYEAAALGRPTVVMNSPRYRKSVNFGLRFWEGIPGPQVNRPENLAPAIKSMLDGEWSDWEFERMRSVRLAYGANGNDGKATQRAVEAIKKYVL